MSVYGVLEMDASSTFMGGSVVFGRNFSFSNTPILQAAIFKLQSSIIRKIYLHPPRECLINYRCDIPKWARSKINKFGSWVFCDYLQLFER